MQKSQLKIIAIVANPEVDVVKNSFYLLKSKAKSANQNDRGCCGNITAIGCCLNLVYHLLSLMVYSLKTK
jgi:hypothetical protein